MVTKALLPCQRIKVGNLNIKHSQEACMWLKDHWGVKHCFMPPYIIDLLENAFENFWETRIFLSNVSIIFTRTNWIKFHYSGTLASTSQYLNGRSSWSLQNSFCFPMQWIESFESENSFCITQQHHSSSLGWVCFPSEEPKQQSILFLEAVAKEWKSLICVVCLKYPVFVECIGTAIN